MKILKNELLAKYTSFDVGGPAEKLIILNSSQEIMNINDSIDWVLGYGTNSVISDKGLTGVTVMLRDGPEPELKDNVIEIDSSTCWDEAVQFAIKNNLSGMELMSGIPGNAGAALSGNIGAYGQTIAHTFLWADVFNVKTNQVKRLSNKDIELSYRHSSLQEQKELIVLKMALELSDDVPDDLAYASAQRVADEMKITPNTLENRRKVILETRKRAGSIYDHSDPNREKTAGSFFKASVVDEQTSRHLATFDESGKTVDQLLEQNKLQGGNAFRASAALVLLAAGFSRGQSWGAVRLHKRHVLKIENSGGANAQQIYDVTQHIRSTVKEKLGISLETEAQFIGHFN